MVKGGYNTRGVGGTTINTAPISGTGTASSVFFDDSCSPYHLSNSDNPGLVLVSTSLIGSNYNSWRRAMVTALRAKNKLCFVDGTLPVPDDDDPFFASWSRCNSMVISWLLNSVSSEIGHSLLYYDTAAEIWVDLKECYSQTSGPRIYQLKKDLMALQQGTLDVNSYFTKLKIIWDELKQFMPVFNDHSWLEFQQVEYIIQFLMGLNESYSHVRAQILLHTPLPPISKVFSLILQEERQRSINISPVDNTFSSDMSPMSNAMVSGYRGKKDHPHCSHCGRPGHDIDHCYKLHGYPPGMQSRSTGSILSNSRNSYSGSNGNSSTEFNASSKGSSHGFANQVFTNVDQTSQGSLDKSLSNEQCHQLIAFLSSQLQHSQVAIPDSQPQASVSSVSGSFHGPNDWDG